MADWKDMADNLGDSAEKTPPAPKRSTRRPPEANTSNPTGDASPKGGKPDGKSEGHTAGKPGGKTSGETAATPADAGGAADAPKGSKLPGANATGVDYSDKGMKDRLEHQAADVVMDATPGLGQFNSARKALKKANKAKKDAGGKEGLSDDVEKVADKAVDTGIKGAKIAVGTNLGSMGGALAVGGALTAKMLLMAKGFAMGLASKAVGVAAGIFQGIATAVTNVLGVGAAVGNFLAGGIIATVTIIGSVVGGTFITQMGSKDPGGLMCAPETKTVDKGLTDYIDDAEFNAQREANAGKLWSVYSALGGTKERAAAVLGNLHHESGGLDPTAMETISSEPFQIGARKQDAISKGYKIDLVDPSYAARFPAIDYMGIGLAQWTNDRNRLLVSYAEGKGVAWYEFDTQVGFMLAGDQSYRQEQLLAFIKDGGGTVDAATETFMNTWIGLSSPNPSLGARQEHALDYMFMLEMATADTAYAESILAGMNVDRGSGNAAADAPFKDDGCGNPVAVHYAGDKAADGTGEVPPGVSIVPWTRETLPQELQQYAADPQKAGVTWGSGGGWAPGVIPDQCVAFATSYFMQLFPSWSSHGASRPTGNGNTTAFGWASHYGESVSSAPSSGAVFSEALSNPYGHTGIVQHVFSNGDILVAEQNVSGVSGELAGMSYSWSWRVIPKAVYQGDMWKFFKPAGEEPAWTKLSA